MWHDSYTIENDGQKNKSKYNLSSSYFLLLSLFIVVAPAAAERRDDEIHSLAFCVAKLFAVVLKHSLPNEVPRAIKAKAESFASSFFFFASVCFLRTHGVRCQHTQKTPLLSMV